MGPPRSSVALNCGRDNLVAAGPFQGAVTRADSFALFAPRRPAFSQVSTAFSPRWFLPTRLRVDSCRGHKSADQGT
jgi:hypothetical protein